MFRTFLGLFYCKNGIYPKYDAKYFEEHIALHIILRMGTDKDNCCLTKGNIFKEGKYSRAKHACKYDRIMKSNTIYLLKFQSMHQMEKLH